MLEQTAEQKLQHNLDIERLLTEVVDGTIKYYIKKYGKTIGHKLGLTEDDLINDMREQIYKGILTHKSTGTANLKTYLNTIIKNRFLLLFGQTGLKKHSSIDYYPNVFSSAEISKDQLETEETGEILLQKRQEFLNDLISLSDEDKIIYQDLALGFNLSEIIRKNKLLASDVIGSIKRIDERLNERRSNTYKGTLKKDNKNE